MTLRVRLIATFLEDQLGALLKFILKSFFAGSLNLLHSLLLPLKHLLRLDELTIPIFGEEGCDSVV